MLKKLLAPISTALLLAIAPIASHGTLITIERISDTEALITGSGALGPNAPLSNANILILLDPFATSPSPSARDSVFTSSSMTVGAVAVNAAEEVGTDFGPIPVLIFGSSATDFALFAGFAGSLDVTLTSGTLSAVGSVGGILWGSNNPAGTWRVVAPTAAAEPGTLALLGLGLAGLAASRRRKQ